jgi:hypothetical protein
VIQLVLALTETMDRAGLQAALAMKDRKSFRELYLKPALVAGYVALTIPDKPNSRLQQYRLTAKGKSLAKAWRRAKP